MALRDAPQVKDLRLVVLLVGPLVAGLALHALCRRLGWLRRWRVPIDRGVRLRRRPLFGANKTWRGVAAVAAGSALGYALLTVAGLLPGGVAPSLSAGQFAFIGALMGAAAMLGELPTSFLKRQLDIAPGTTGRGALAPVVWLLDQLGVLVGCWLVLGPIVGFSAPRLAWSALVVGVARPLASLAGARLDVESAARGT